ncbi:MAG: insulinase family protein [Leptolinea sp.]|jgi:zinc protease|nr:insulinase family protein [Leptolinea sp.]
MTSAVYSHLNSLPGPDDIHRYQLHNGIILLTRPNFNNQSVVVNGYLQCGSMNDPREKLGLAHFTALSLMRGSTRRDFQQTYDALESVGASLGFSSSVHHTSFGGRCLSEDLPLVFEILSDSLREPTFPVDQIERLRTQLLTGLAIRAQDTDEMASLTFDETLFANHPYGLPEDGYVETISQITRDDIQHFQNVFYHPRGMVIVVVGAVEPETCYDLVCRTLGNWMTEKTQPVCHFPIVQPLSQNVRRHISIPGKSQSDVIIGTLGPKRNVPEYMAASLGNSVLGQFGMMGRIGDVVREKSGLAYHASASLNSWIESGSWEVSAGVNPANLDRTIDLVIRELKRFIGEPVTAEELADSQANFIGRLPLSLESNGGVAGALLNIERFQLGLDYYRRYADMIRAVTPDLVLETARRYINPDRLAIISAGPEK